MGINFSGFAGEEADDDGDGGIETDFSLNKPTIDVWNIVHGADDYIQCRMECKIYIYGIFRWKYERLKLK